MELKFVGTGSAFSGDINNSAYLLKDKTLFLIDCGENVFNTLLNSKLLDEIDNIYVFITHTHSDHIGSLSSLIHYMYYAKNKTVNILNADNYLIKDDIETILKLNGNSKEQYAFVDKQIIANYLNLKWIDLYEVKHTPKLKSYAIKITEEYNSKLSSIVFTGDTCDEDFILEQLNDQTLKSLYCDISMYDGPHLKYDRAMQILSPYKDKIVFMHLENGYIKNRLKKAGFKYANQSIKMVKMPDLYIK